MNRYKKLLVTVRLVREKSPKMVACSPEAVVKLVRKEMENFDREYLVSVFLGTDNGVLGIEECSKGTLNTAPVSVREIFKSGILCSANSLILLHNHPSGACDPSAEDVKVTKTIQEAGKIIGIELLDHIVVGDGTYTSLKEKGQL